MKAKIKEKGMIAEVRDTHLHYCAVKQVRGAVMRCSYAVMRSQQKRRRHCFLQQSREHPRHNICHRKEQLRGFHLRLFASTSAVTTDATESTSLRRTDGRGLVTLMTTQLSEI